MLESITKNTTSTDDDVVHEISMTDEINGEKQVDKEKDRSLYLALVNGETMNTLPTDLYIPPDAMEVILEIFEGPLDLLLYLIRKQNLDILNIPVAAITEQYMEYVELMTNFRLELAADYLEMAALLAEIKSRMLLPRPPAIEGEEQDPRAELVRRLQEYERIKTAAVNLDQLPRWGREIFPVKAALPPFEVHRSHPDVDLKEILLAFKNVLKRIDLKADHHIQKEGLSLREKMSHVLSKLDGDRFIDFVDLFEYNEGRLGIVVTFLALLELLRQSMIELVQTELFGPIYVRVPGC